MSTKSAKNGYKSQTGVPAECETEGGEAVLVWGGVTNGSEKAAK